MTALPCGELEPRRTTEFSRAFTLADFAWGAIVAFLAFQPMGIIIGFCVGVASGWEQLQDSGPISSWPGALLYGVIGAVFSALYGFVPSIIALLAGSPAAYFLGRSLARVQPVWIHLAAFAAYGLVIGALTSTTFQLVIAATSGATPSTTNFSDLAFYWPFDCASGVAVAWGRWKALQRTTKKNAALPQ